MTVLGSADSTRVVRADLVRSGLLYAGTETGIYVSFDYGATWQLLQLDKQKGDAHLFRPTTLYSNLPAKSLQFSLTRPTISGLSALNWQLPFC